jgi:hypothetical protein
MIRGHVEEPVGGRALSFPRQIAAGRERLVPHSLQHNHADARIAVRQFNRDHQLLHGLVGKGVELVRTIDGDARNRAAARSRAPLVEYIRELRQVCGDLPRAEGRFDLVFSAHVVALMWSRTRR